MAVRSCVRPFERPPRHGAHQVEPEFGVRMDIFHRLDRVGGGFRRGAEALGVGPAAGEHGFGRGHPSRPRLGAADPDPRRDACSRKVTNAIASA